MKTFKRTHLPIEIKYNGKIYTYNAEKSAKAQLGLKLGLETDCVVIEVLSKNLNGKIDFHGNYYKPTKHIFTLNN